MTSGEWGWGGGEGQRRKTEWGKVWCAVRIYSAVAWNTVPPSVEALGAPLLDRPMAGGQPGEDPALNEREST